MKYQEVPLIIIHITSQMSSTQTLPSDLSLQETVDGLSLQETVDGLCPKERNGEICDVCPHIHIFSPFAKPPVAHSECREYSDALFIPPITSYLSDDSWVKSTALGRWYVNDPLHFKNLYTHKLSEGTLNQIVTIFGNGNLNAPIVFKRAKEEFPGNHDAHVYIMMRLITKYYDRNWSQQAIDTVFSLCKRSQ